MKQLIFTFFFKFVNIFISLLLILALKFFVQIPIVNDDELSRERERKNTNMNLKKSWMKFSKPVLLVRLFLYFLQHSLTVYVVNYKKKNHIYSFVFIQTIGLYNSKYKKKI